MNLRLFVVLTAAAGGLLASVPAAADPAACAAVDAANVKQSHTPFHSTTTDNGRRAQSITTGDARYMQIGSKWFKRPHNASDIQLAAKTPGVSCGAGGREAVGSEAAAIYTVHHASDGATADMKYWISVSRGLPLRTSTALTTSAGKHQIEVTYDYANVRPPPGV